MSQWPTFRDGGGLRQVADSPLEEHYWNDTFEREFRGQIDSWAFAWTFNVWSRGGLTALPDVNLISNIGFDAESTHTRDAHHALSCLPTLELPQPLRHPSEVVRNVEADRHTFEHAFGAETSAADLPWGKRLERSVRKVRDRVLAAWRKPGGRSNKPAFLG